MNNEKPIQQINFKFCLYTGYIADIRTSAVICFDEVCAMVWHPEFTLSDRKGKRSLVLSILWLKMRQWLA